MASSPGAESLGDPVFLSLGNDGYRVLAYLLDFAYDATTRLVTATAPLEIRTTQALSRFSLDALGLNITSVRLVGRPAERPDERAPPRQLGHPVRDQRVEARDQPR